MLLNFFLCSLYFPNVEFPEDRHLIKSQSRRKTYYYNYYQTSTTYYDARRICQSKGDGWDVASFQAAPNYYLNHEGNSVKGQTWISGDYEKSVRNVE